MRDIHREYSKLLSKELQYGNLRYSIAIQVFFDLYNTSILHDSTDTDFLIFEENSMNWRTCPNLGCHI
jgi:hypothetical protein